MAIHHDKHAYGNLEKLDGDMSEAALLKMLSALKDEEEEEKEELPDSEKEEK